MTASMSEEPGSPQSFNELKLQESEFGASCEIHVPTHPRSHRLEQISDDEKV